MTGKSIIIEVHGWRRPKMSGGPLGRVLCLGFVSVCYAPFVVSDWLQKKITELRGVANPHARVEMACADVDGLERINKGRPLHVPSGRK